jgi:hypothetical protein
MDSILQQTFTQFDVFVMCDGPLKPHIDEYLSSIDDNRITLLKRDENQGLAQSLNELIEEAMQRQQYEFCARMDADDICHMDRFQKQIEYLEHHEAVDIISCWCEEIDEKNNTLYVKKLPPDDATLKRDLIKRNPFNHPAIMARMKIFKSGFRYDPAAHLVEDYKLWVTLAMNGFTFGNIQEPLLRFRVDPDFYSRRSGIQKAFIELKVKYRAMEGLKDYRISNFIYLLLYFFLRLSPPFILKMIYKHFR